MGNRQGVAATPVKASTLWDRDEVSKKAWETLSEEDDSRVELSSYSLPNTPVERSGTENFFTEKTPHFRDHRKYLFPFDNLAFEGGGAKGLVYAGVMKCLAEAGIKPKRVAGTSAGAITATLVAAGCSPDELKQLCGSDLETMLLDHKYGYLSLLPSLLSGFGWNSADKFYTFLGGILEKKLGKADITFLQLYKKMNVELCITGFNVNMMTLEYFHPKVTPNMKVRDAVRISMSIPGVFKAVQLPHPDGSGTDYYVDGGFANNYPVHVFDGWFLSMDPEHSFFNKMPKTSCIDPYQLRKDMYGLTGNPNTLGFVVHKQGENELMQVYLQDRTLPLPVPAPDTELSREHFSKQSSREGKLKNMMIIWKAIVRLVCDLRDHEGYEGNEGAEGRPDAVSKEGFISAIETARAGKNEGSDISMRKIDVELLFGEAPVDAVFQEIDLSADDEVSFHELLCYFQRRGFLFKKLFLGHDRESVDGILSFFSTIGSGLMNNSQKKFMKANDVDRTVGINTGYVGTMDFKLDPEDQDYMVQSGYEATRAYLHDYIGEHKPPLKKSSD